MVLQGTLHEIRAVDVILNIESMRGLRNDLIECNSEEICGNNLKYDYDDICIS